ncbi:MAG: hypothetical protein COB98_03800 [Flavobacteriaceae bacterium]|nr:MAG: hypothetical protein COB98_03800 [Flavobacteriaceae bacterium]
MKTKLLFVMALLSIATTFSQTIASASGIAVQGIARDETNTVKANETLSFSFNLYYKNTSNIEEVIYTKENVSIVTDNFGVFSYVIPYNGVNEHKIQNNETFLRISESTVVISDEQLSSVPYAIVAGNGVPTGSIMPFIGTVSPAGWHLCDGTALPVNAVVLIAMVGANSPDLQGMFLRGVGTNSLTSITTTLKATQDDTFEKHMHDKGTLNTRNAGLHNHDTAEDDGFNRVLKRNGKETSASQDNSASEPNVRKSEVISDDGLHHHTIIGATGNRGDGETRPVNYGVHYIIKL